MWGGYKSNFSHSLPPTSFINDCVMWLAVVDFLLLQESRSENLTKIGVVHLLPATCYLLPATCYLPPAT
jgi:hypothetical protein